MANHRRRFNPNDPRCWTRAAAAGAIGTIVTARAGQHPLVLGNIPGGIAIRGEHDLPGGKGASQTPHAIMDGLHCPNADLITIEDMPEGTEPRLFHALPSILDERLVSETTGLSSRITDPLAAVGIETVETLIGNSEEELLAIKGFGPHALTRVLNFLWEHELKLKGDE